MQGGGLIVPLSGTAVFTIWQVPFAKPFSEIDFR
jgi:hypothetical protein